MYSVDSESEKKEILKRYRNLLKVARLKDPNDRKQIRKAFNIAVDAHKDMRRKSGEPYIYHPLHVATICAQEIGLGTTSVICALLHDVVEDTDYTIEDIRGLFGDKIASIIDGLTKIKEIFDYKTASIQAENIKKILITLSDDVRVILIKLADRLHNLRTLDALSKEKQLKVASETIYLYAPLAHRLGLNAIKTEMEDLSLKYTEPEVYEFIVTKLRESAEGRTRFINKFIYPIKKKMAEQGFKFSITAREKSVYSIWSKMKKKEIPLEEVYDVFAVRIIIDTPIAYEKADCWKVYSIVTDNYIPNSDRLRDWISIPKANGYEALHTTVMSHTGEWVEIQIRSRRMDEVAEMGYAAHWKYKDSLRVNSQLDNWLDRIREMIESSDDNAFAFIDDFKGYFFLDEISVFTPNGELRTLPANSTVLDFAYAIHSEIGNTCIGAKVDKKLVPINAQLKNGQQVEVITSSRQTPREEWLGYAMTTRAKTNIKLAVREEKKKYYQTGHDRLKGWFEKYNLEFSDESVRNFLTAMNFSSKLDLFYSVSQDKITLKDVKVFAASSVGGGWFNIFTKSGSRSIREHSHPEKEKQTMVASREIEKTLKGEIKQSGFEVAVCCNPLPGDEVIGLIASDHLPIEIHRTNCPKAIELISSFGNKFVKLNWSNRESISFQAGIKFTGIDKIGLINDISTVISNELNLNIKSFHLETENGLSSGKILLFVDDVFTLNRVLLNLKKVEGIRNISRVD